MNAPGSRSGSPRYASALAALERGDLVAAAGAAEAALAQSASAEARGEGARLLADIATRAESEDPALAERALALATSACPEYADLQCRRARLLLRLDRRAEARRALDRALTTHPRFVEARLERALLEAREGRVGEALDSLRVLQRDVSPLEARVYQQGLRSLERADWEEAGSLLRRGLAIESTELDEEISATRRCLANGEAAEAARRAGVLLARHPAFPDLHALLGAAELERGHLDDALSSLGRALELNPDFHEARVLFARTLEAQGAFAAAVGQAGLVLELVPDHPGALEIHARGSRRRSPASRSAGA